MKNLMYPCLWFDGNALEAAEFYCTVISDSKILSSDPMVVRFWLNGQQFMALNGGPLFTFNESVSFVIECDTQEEIDYYWDKLTSNGGQEGNCGWLKDKYGLSWQIVPSILPQLLSNPGKANNVIEKFRTMKKFDIDTLLNA